MPARPGPYLVEVRWTANPLRGDKFEAAWLPAAEAALDYGATHWALYRLSDGKLDFVQHAVFPDKESWERYWYSDEIGQARADAASLYQVPLLPTLYYVAGEGSAKEVSAAS